MERSKQVPVPDWQGDEFACVLVQVTPASILQSLPQPSPLACLPSSHSSPGSMFPSPHVVEQAWLWPALSRQFGSLVQVFEQPVASPKKRPFWPLQPLGRFAGSLPQSHCSPVSLIAFPQAAFLQGWPGVGGQVEPGSTWHVLEQPSPLTVFPSSQVSLPVSLLSPQIGEQGLPGTRHSQPGSILWQSAEQPSPLTVFPSSQVSSMVSILLPHTV